MTQHPSAGDSLSLDITTAGRASQFTEATKKKPAKSAQSHKSHRHDGGSGWENVDFASGARGGRGGGRGGRGGVPRGMGKSFRLRDVTDIQRLFVELVLGALEPGAEPAVDLLA